MNVALPIVPDESFFRRLPAALHPSQRLLLDAVVASTDIISCSVHTLRGFAEEFGGDVQRIGTLDLARAFGAAWTIVDQLHATRELFLRFGKMGELTTAFMQQSEVAEKLRHKMDHLHQNLDNLAGSKRPSTPVFGSLSYVVLDAPPPGGGFIVWLTAGAVLGKTSAPLVNPFNAEPCYPAYGFQLSAFGKKLSFEPPLVALKTMLDANAEAMREQIEEFVDQQAAQAGHDPAKLKAHGPRGIMIATRFEFGGSPEASPPADRA